MTTSRRVTVVPVAGNDPLGPYCWQSKKSMFDKDLHDRLLEDAIAADPHAPGLTLINVLAQQQAKVLLESGNDYF